MPHIRWRSTSIAVVLFTLACGVSAQAQKRGITEMDLFRFVWIADPQISPDGSQVAFVRVTVNEKEDQYDTSIWLVPADRTEPPRQLTRGTRDTAPRWSPDGRRLAFVRATDTEGRAQPPQIHVLSLDGGEARAVTNIPRGANNPAWSPDGTRIAFSSTAWPSEVKDPNQREESGDKPEAKEK